MNSSYCNTSKAKDYKVKLTIEVSISAYNEQDAEDFIKGELKKIEATHIKTNKIKEY